MKARIIIPICISILVALFGCSPSKAVLEAVLQETLAAMPTQTAYPTYTNIPIHTNVPTRTQNPTYTPKPTLEPVFEPTETTTPSSTPMPTQDPNINVVLSGFQDSVENVNMWGPGVLTIISIPTKTDNFIVSTFNANGELINVLVNTIGGYSGVRPFNWADEEKAEQIQIQTYFGGNWTIIFSPIYSEDIHSLTVPGTYKATGDDVVRILGNASTASFIVNQGEENFFVSAHENDGNTLEYLVNEIGPYRGTVMIPPGTSFLVVEASGEWQVDVKAR
jgi:hypothetical protein